MNEGSQPRNFLLRQLPQEQFKDFLKVAEFVHLDIREPIIEPLKSIMFVDFPETGVISIVTLVGERMVEIANVGNEGFIGVPVLLNVKAMSERAFCQIEATAWRIATENFQELLTKNSKLQTLCQKYIATYLNQIACNTSCNWVHSIEERCARWLLMAHDRVDGNEFILTQEFLAVMLGASRGGVNLAAGVLANAGLITYVRGKIIILDRNGLELVACDCYSSIRDYFNQTFDL